MVIAWKLQVRLTALEIGELLREALFQRFAYQPHQAKGLEFLTDNGPEFISDHLRQLVTRLGLIACHTPCRSPQSNGLVESFFGSFKRDYPLQRTRSSQRSRHAIPNHFLSTVVDKITHSNHINTCPVLTGSHHLAPKTGIKEPHQANLVLARRDFFPQCRPHRKQVTTVQSVWPK